MKHYLIKLLTNTQGQDGSSIAVYTDSEDKSAKDKAEIAYHQTMATFIDAKDVLHAVVKVLDYNGTNVLTGHVDHTPEPEPEKEPISENE